MRRLKVSVEILNRVAKEEHFSMELGEPDYAFDISEVNLIVGRMWMFFRPSNLLHSAWYDIVSNGYNESRKETAITRLSSNSQTDRLVRDRQFEEWVRPRLEGHPAFQALNQQLDRMGIDERGYFGYGEYSGQMGTWGFKIRKRHLEMLERMAQDEAGLSTNKERDVAAANFRIYMRRNYDKNWEENRKNLPEIDKSPYAVESI